MQPGARFGIDRVEIDDTPAALVPHHRESRLHGPPCAPQASAQHAVEHVVSLLLQQDVRGQGYRVVDQHVQAAEPLDRPTDRGEDVRLAPDIGANKGRRAESLYLLKRPGARLLVDLDDHDGRALARVCPSDPSPDPLATARDQGRLAVKSSHRTLLSPAEPR